MTYVGAVPTTGDFKVLDSITTSSATTFNLRQGGVAVYPQSANHCLVVLNGVLQTAGSSFNIVNDTIVFASSLSSSDVINQILVLGNVNDIGVPSDDTVSTAKLQSSAVTDAKISAMASSKLTGVVPTANLGSGTASSSTVLYGDQTYKAEPSGNLVKLAQANSLTNTGTINIDSVFTSVYTGYRFLCTFKPVNSDVHCTFRWRDGGSDLTVSQYYGSCRGGYVNGSGAGAQSFSDWGSSSAKIADSLNNNNYNALHLDMLLYPYNSTGVANIGSIDNASVIVYQSHYWADGERQEQVSGGNTYTQTTVPDGFGFDLSGGDFDGYNYALFGYKG